MPNPSLLNAIFPQRRQHSPREDADITAAQRGTSAEYVSNLMEAMMGILGVGEGNVPNGWYRGGELASAVAGMGPIKKVPSSLKWAKPLLKPVEAAGEVLHVPSLPKSGFKINHPGLGENAIDTFAQNADQLKIDPTAPVKIKPELQSYVKQKLSPSPAELKIDETFDPLLEQTFGTSTTPRRDALAVAKARRGEVRARISLSKQNERWEKLDPHPYAPKEKVINTQQSRDLHESLLADHHDGITDSKIAAAQAFDDFQAIPKFKQDPVTKKWSKVPINGKPPYPSAEVAVHPQTLEPEYLHENQMTDPLTGEAISAGLEDYVNRVGKLDKPANGAFSPPDKSVMMDVRRAMMRGNSNRPIRNIDNASRLSDVPSKVVPEPNYIPSQQSTLFGQPFEKPQESMKQDELLYLQQMLQKIMSRR